jgi:hypothetical protein
VLQSYGPPQSNRDRARGAKDEKRNADERARQEWDEIDRAVKEFVPLAAKEPKLSKSGLRRHWKVVVERYPGGETFFVLRAYPSGAWDITYTPSIDSDTTRGIVARSSKRAPFTRYRVNPSNVRRPLTTFLATGTS